jgi:predicted lipid carrier protein YhbT
MSPRVDGLDTLLRRPRSRAALAVFAHVDDTPATRRAALRVMPLALEQQFAPAAAGDLSTVFELRVLAPDGQVEARFALEIAAGALSVVRRPAPEAAAWVAVGLGDMIRLVTGDTEIWPLMAAKRLDIGGEPFTALRFPALFGL